MNAYCPIFTRETIEQGVGTLDCLYIVFSFKRIVIGSPTRYLFFWISCFLSRLIEGKYIKKTLDIYQRKGKEEKSSA